MCRFRSTVQHWLGCRLNSHDGTAMRRAAIPTVAVLIGLLIVGCSGRADEASARAAVAEMHLGEILEGDSVDRFRIDAVTVDWECAVAEITQLPSLSEWSLFVRWDSRMWVRTNVAPGHDLQIDVTANDCWQP